MWLITIIVFFTHLCFFLSEMLFTCTAHFSIGLFAFLLINRKSIKVLDINYLLVRYVANVFSWVDDLLTFFHGMFCLNLKFLMAFNLSSFLSWLLYFV